MKGHETRSPSGETFVGLISGTSIDGVDAAIVSFDGERPRMIAGRSRAFPNALRRDLRAAPAALGVAELARLDAAVGEAFAAAALAVIREAGLTPGAIRAIGSHGQTVWHGAHADAPVTVQIGDPNRIAERTGITTVADFRRRDMAAGGEGAPLAPAFHAGLLGRERPCTLVNIGGIANLTVLERGEKAPRGYDSGPGNTLMDAWCRRHLGQPFDRDGRWAAEGSVSQDLLRRLREDPYFDRIPPKSTGPEHFSPEWLHARVRGEAPETVQATLLELTAGTIAEAVARDAGDAGHRILLCGGGAHNTTLVTRLAELLAPAVVQDTSAAGLDPDYVEALGFAWLARQTLLGRPGNAPSVTGAERAVVLGGIYPGVAGRV